MKPSISLVAASFLIIGAGAAWYSMSHQKGAGATSKPIQEDRPLAAFRIELLDLAFRAASAMPVDPHVKDRSRAQETVVSAALELDQPARALRYTAEIANWRRGAGYANVGLYCARHGAHAQALSCLEKAGQLADEEGRDPDSQEWRRDRIRAIVARTYSVLGDDQKAAEFGGGLAESEVDHLDLGSRIDANGVEAFLLSLDEAEKAGNYDRVVNGLRVCARLFDRFYSDPDLRARAERRVRGSYQKLPPDIRIDLLAEIAGHALQHHDREKALEIVDVAQVLVDEGKWLPQDQVPTAARLAEIRFKAGDAERARKDLASALALFESKAPSIVDIQRAGALRPVAEAYQAMGDSASALKIYTRVVEEGIKNPNSRPRAEDFTATCCSMALHAFEPDTTLRAQLTRVCDGLRQPW